MFSMQKLIKYSIYTQFITTRDSSSISSNCKGITNLHLKENDNRYFSVYFIWNEEMKTKH